MNRQLNILTLCLALGACISPLDTPNVLLEQLQGRWKLTGVFQNGIQIADTIGKTTLHSVKIDYVQTTYTISTDSGLHQHIYKDDELFRRRPSARPWIIDFGLEGGVGTSRQYYLVGNQITKEQEFTIPLDSFVVEYTNGPVLRYSWIDIGLLELNRWQLVLEVDGKEYHYTKLGNGL